MGLGKLAIQCCIYMVTCTSEAYQVLSDIAYNYSLFRGLPVEVLHTILLDCCKAFLKAIIPKLTSAQNTEVLARILAFNHSGFKVKIRGKFCYH